MSACAWCGEKLARRENERPSAFARRRHCSRSCQVCTQNSERAARNRRDREPTDVRDGA